MNNKTCPFCKNPVPTGTEVCPICHRTIVERFDTIKKEYTTSTTHKESTTKNRLQVLITKARQWTRTNKNAIIVAVFFVAILLYDHLPRTSNQPYTTQNTPVAMSLPTQPIFSHPAEKPSENTQGNTGNNSVVLADTGDTANADTADSGTDTSDPFTALLGKPDEQ